MNIIKDAKRFCIKLNEIKATNNIYKTTNNFKVIDITKNKKISYISVFSKEYIPKHFKSNFKYFIYSLEINGKLYDIVPINSNEDGIKIIKKGSNNIKVDNVLYVTDDIYNVNLYVTLKCNSSTETPFCDINFLLGDEI